DRLLLNLEVLLRLDSLVEAVRPAATRHETSGEVVDDDDLAVLDDIVAVAGVEDLRLERRLHVSGEAEVLGRVDVVDVQGALDLLHATLSEGDRLELLVDGEVELTLEARDEGSESRVDRRVVL